MLAYVCLGEWVGGGEEWGRRQGRAAHSASPLTPISNTSAFLTLRAVFVGSPSFCDKEEIPPPPPLSPVSPHTDQLPGGARIRN